MSERTFRNIVVLIPLNSGLVFVFRQGYDYQRVGRLNPFEFRAGICFQATTLSLARCVLIPLNSGLVFVSRTQLKHTAHFSLNPFEFRAGICLCATVKQTQTAGLNPFEFRAGICLTHGQSRQPGLS